MLLLGSAFITRIRSPFVVCTCRTLVDGLDSSVDLVILRRLLLSAARRWNWYLETLSRGDRSTMLSGVGPRVFLGDFGGFFTL